MNNTTLVVEEAFEPIVLPEYIAMTSLVLCSIILAVGIAGNLLVIVVILTSKVLRSSTNLFLLNLSVADLLVLVTCTPTSLVEIATRTDAWLMGKMMCYLVPFVELSVSHTSILTILAITVERYYAICLPLRAGVVWTKSKACLTCLVAWLFAFGLTAPILAMIEYTAKPDEDPGCLTRVDTYWQKFYFIFIITVFFFIPLLILILLYLSIARNLVPGPSTDGDEQVIADSASILRSRKQVVTMLFTVVCFFFACMLPFKVLTLWIVTLQVDVLDVIDVETFYLLLYFSRVMFYINSAINPILYNIMSSKFREGFKRVFHCVDWPLSPRRRAMTTTTADWKRRTTYTSSTYTSHQTKSCCRLELVERPSARSSRREAKATFQTTPECLNNSHTEAVEPDYVTQQYPRCSSSARRRHQTREEAKNIVFIEERKILLIPTSSANVEDIHVDDHGGQTKPSSGQGTTTTTAFLSSGSFTTKIC